MLPRKPHHKGFKTRTKGLRPKGKSRRSMDRQAWQREMMRTYAHIQHCEWPGGCSNTFGLAHAHRLKKTKITTREEWLMCAKLCGEHHRGLDEATGEDVHRRMYDVITHIIESRALRERWNACYEAVDVF